MKLEDGPLYTPEQVSANQWLGDRSPAAIRRAVSRGQLQHTKSGGKVCFSRANILANQAAGLELADWDQSAHVVAPHRKRRTSDVATKPSVTVLQPRPNAARRRSRRDQAAS